MNEVFSIKDGEHQVRLGNEVLPTTWNSSGAAASGMEVEIRRRCMHETADTKVMVSSDGSCTCSHKSCAKTQGSPTVLETPEHERYVWLRDGKSRYGGWGGSAPFVMSPGRSRLYAIHQLRAEALDAEIDADIFYTKASELHESNEVIERRIIERPMNHPANEAWHCDRDGEEYINALDKLTQQLLGWTDERTKIALDYLK